MGNTSAGRKRYYSKENGNHVDLYKWELNYFSVLAAADSIAYKTDIFGIWPIYKGHR